MKKLIGLICLIGIGITLYHWSTATTVEAKPQETKQMWIYYSQMDASEVILIQCYTSGDGYWCPASGVGGGGNARVM
ncbi:MAG: hypothetical protein E6L04_07345 [Thaumarchaeota archaeon]|nr:MAG: hypothetical protein E6L04_07345 [Nitrososphaerota archaeon]